MKLAIMQPYFFPYIGYFSLIKNTDQFILFDSVQFINHGWIERNRILKPGEGWQYISVPLIKHSRETKIKDIQINNSSDWRDRIFRQLEHYKKRAPFYDRTMEVVKEALNIQTNSIVQLNKHVLNTVCEYIGIKADIHIFSEMNLLIDKVNAPDEWALNICKKLGGVDEYWNPEGGLDFFHRYKYEREAIEIKFLKMRLTKYPQRRKEFIEGLSIIDMLMFLEPDNILERLDDYDII
jgi:hypothetical protein